MKKISNYIHAGCRYFIAFDLIVVAFVLTVNVVLRYVFASSWAWAEELTRYLVAWCTFVGAACCITEGSDITIDSILSLLSRKGQRILSIITTVISILFILLFVYVSAQMTIRAFQNGQMATAMKMPLWIAYFSMPVGGTLSLYRFIEKLVGLLRQQDPKEERGEE